MFRKGYSYLRKILKLEEFKINNILENTNNSILIKAEGLDLQKQCCPNCSEKTNVIFNGKNEKRSFRNGLFGEYRVFVEIPIQRLYCNRCGQHYVYEYQSVGKHSKYSEYDQEKNFKLIKGSTVKQIAEHQKLPVKTLEHQYKRRLKKKVSILKKKALKRATNMDVLILSIDDHSIKKRKKYKTIIYNLLTGEILAILKGRSYDELIDQFNENEDLQHLNPDGVVMDMAGGYKNFVKKAYKNAYIIMDRFHIQQHLNDTFKEVIRELGKDLSKENKKILWKNKKAFCTHSHNATEDQQESLKQMFKIEPRLQTLYHWKEIEVKWYQDEQPSVIETQRLLAKWIKDGETFNIDSLTKGLKTLKKRLDTVSNFHIYRYTNGKLEGLHNKIKAIKRRKFGIRNQEIYDLVIFYECA